MATTTFSGPVVSNNGFIGDLTGRTTNTPVNVTAATLAVTAADHASRVVTLNKADGQTVTLPAATGTGDDYRFFIGTTITSVGTVIKVASASDIMAGTAIVANDTDASASVFETAADSDTITLNGTTTGGYAGCMIELSDVASGVWWVRVTGAATGAEATPFSATVS